MAITFKPRGEIALVALMVCTACASSVPVSALTESQRESSPVEAAGDAVGMVAIIAEGAPSAPSSASVAPVAGETEIAAAEPAAATMPADAASVAASGVPGAKYPERIPAVSLAIPENALVAKYVAQYTSAEGIKYLSAIMKRTVPYRSMIMSELDGQGVPECLFYLPVIESGFSVNAVSRSGATGLWQFMKNSVSGYGIRMNDWMDERRDPWLTTTAAIKKLNENYRDLGDWNLALAAYNCGLGATRKAVKKGGTSDYWELCRLGLFKSETVHYVPKFLAIASVLARSRELGIDWGDDSAAEELTTIPVKRPVDINVLAKETGLEAAALKAANPALFYHITPPDVTYALRIPASRQAEIETTLADKSKMLLEFYMYKIKSGDTLYALALHYGVSVDMILQYNPGVSPKTLKIGKNVVIPALKEVGSFKGKKDPDTLDFSGNYLVKQGDSLWSIALAYGIQVETLADKNNLDVNSVLKLGKALRVPIL